MMKDKERRLGPNYQYDISISQNRPNRDLLVMKAIGITWMWGCLAFIPSVGSAQTELAWNQWRGANRDGIASNFRLPNALTDKELQRQWRVEMGPSYSGPVLDEKCVYVTETVDKQYEVVRALDRATGQEVWRAQWKGAMRVPFFAAANGSWIRGTPLLDAGRLYVCGMVDNLVCLNASNGEEIWRIDFPNQHGSAKPDFGFVSSPLVHEDSIYVQAGAAVQRIDKTTGQIIWKSLHDSGGMFGSAFSSPMIAEIQGQLQLVVQTRTTLAGLNLQSGSVLWSKEIPNFRGMNILTPLIVGNSIFTSSYQNKAWRLDIRRQGDVWNVEQAWEVPRTAYMSSPVYQDGHVYLQLANQRFVCLNFANGETKWTSPPFGKYASLARVGKRILALDQRGELLLFEAQPEQFELVSRVRISDQETWAHLAPLGNQLFIRELNAIAAWKITASDAAIE